VALEPLGREGHVPGWALSGTEGHHLKHVTHQGVCLDAWCAWRYAVM